MTDSSKYIPPIDSNDHWKRVATGQEPVSVPLRIKEKTSTGAPIPEGAVIVGPRDFCPEG